MYHECRHIKACGTKCGTPCLTGRVYCYFHFRANQQRLRAANSTRDLDPAPARIATPMLEDRVAIQLAISEVVCALADNRLDRRRAATLLYGLQVASRNVGTELELVATDPVRELSQNEQGEDIGPETVAPDEGEELVYDEDEDEDQDEEEGDEDSEDDGDQEQDEDDDDDEEDEEEDAA